MVNFLNTTNGTGDRLLEPEVSTNVFYSIGTCFSVLFVIAFLEDTSVLIVYHRTKKLHIRTNIWIVAILYCDLLIVLNAFPIVIISSFAKKHVFGDIGCKWDGFMVTTLGTASIFLLTGLSLHRYLVMTKCNSNTIPKMHVILSVCVCCGFGVFWGVTPLFGWGSFALEGIGISCAPNWRSKTFSDLSYIIAMYIFVLFIPVLIMIFCYTAILLKVSLVHFNRPILEIAQRKKIFLHTPA